MQPKLRHKVLGFFTRDRLLKAGAGAAIGSLLALIFFGCVYALQIKTGLNIFLNFLLLAGVAAGAFLFLFLLMVVGLNIVKRVNLIILALISTAIMISVLLPNTYFSLPFILIQILSGFLIGFTFSKGAKKIWRVVAISVAVTINVLVLYFLISPGRDKTVPVTKSYWEQKSDLVKMNNPAEAGSYSVKELFYGSGNDKHRPEYEGKVSIRTNPVDATAFFDQSRGIKNAMRKFYWGFNSKNYPLNARVWYPEADGIFPLVLIVHGNSLMTHNSDNGYGYIGQLLASKGYIVASIDENFLNLAWFGDYYFSEFFVRGWLILKHLENWRTWNETQGSIFHKKVDMNNIALIGHSRGGEAVSIAAVLNKMNKYTLDATQTFNFGFSIKSIIQIAPTDFYSLQSEVPFELENIDYLLLHGGFDQDMYWNMGTRTFNKINFTDSGYHFKMALYIYKANHGQFNTSWGREDDQPPASWFLNTKSILPAEEQRKIAQIYISSFLETTLKGKNEYMPLFRDYRNGFPVLPKDYYISMFADSRYKYLAKFNEDLEVGSASLPGCIIEGNYLKTWKEDAIPLRMENGSTQINVGVFLGWDQKKFANKAATYSLHLPNGDIKSLKIDSAGSFVFDVCNNTNDINDIDFSIELSTGNGTLKTTLKQHLHLPPLLETNLTKQNPFYKIKNPSRIERVMQSVQIPFSEFKQQGKLFNPSEINAITFIFDKTPIGEIILDNIGFY
ncbi:MAG: hypothetical protein BGN92_07640 [Sphingobacteriales bacterium 41-5]|nr:MAG: hypothetical protein BGN92_07640 [Sphingobacteriales bacterium 41-5]